MESVKSKDKNKNLVIYSNMCLGNDLIYSIPTMIFQITFNWF